MLKPWAGATTKGVGLCYLGKAGAFTFMNSVLWLSSAGHESGFLESFHPWSTPGWSCVPRGRWLGVTAVFFLSFPKGCLQQPSALGYRRALPEALWERFVSDGMSGCFAPGTSHNAGRARLEREQHSTEEQRLSRDGTWALQGDSGFEQENPEAFTISGSWDQPLVVAG